MPLDGSNSMVGTKGRAHPTQVLHAGTPVIESIVTQHAEEAAFLWLLRDRAVHAPHFSLSDLAKLDGRVEAHIDGLRIAGDAGWEVCKDALDSGEAGEIFAAAVLAFESGTEERTLAVLEAAEARPEASSGLVWALCWLSWEEAEVHVRKLLADESPLRRGCGVAACAVQRQDPGTPLIHVLKDGHPASSSPGQRER
jgi:uncharacterized protein (TIGR02270 family)